MTKPALYDDGPTLRMWLELNLARRPITAASAQTAASPSASKAGSASSTRSRAWNQAPEGKELQ